MNNLKLNLPIPSLDQGLLHQIRAGLPVSVFGMSFGERAYTVAASGRFFVWVATDYAMLSETARELNQILGGGVLTLTGRGDVLTFAEARDSAMTASRAQTIAAILRKQCKGVVVTVDALMQLMPSPLCWNAGIVDLSKGESIAPSEIARRLVSAGYKRADVVTGSGQFSLRGDILDVYATGAEQPYRIEFWGDFIESIKRFELESMLSVGEEQAITLLPATEGVFDPENRAAVLKAILRDIPSNLAPDEKARAERIVSTLAASVEGGCACHEAVLPYVEHALLDEYLPEDTLMVYDETKAVFDNVAGTHKEHLSRYKNLLATGSVLKRAVEQIVDFDTLRTRYARFHQLSFARITSSNLFFDPQALYNTQCAPLTRYALDFRELATDLRHWSLDGYKVLLCCRNFDGVAVVDQGLKEQGLTCKKLANDELCSGWSGVALAPFALDRGFSLHDDKIIAVGTDDIFPRRTKKLRKAGAKAMFIQPVKGDYVVHYVHGIGLCNGTVRLTNSMGSKDYIEVEYRDGDKLFVPVDQMDLLTKYTGDTPRLNKMGGGEFSRVKKRVRESVQAMAFDLARLYRDRMEAKGHAYEVDEGLMKEFIDAFPYESTADQITATNEIMSDLKSGKIMDRLLVGDVGYGKTEVALRAAFAVAMEGHQVAFLAPTTILSEQHYVTASKRLEAFGVRIAVLNRFTAKKKADQILSDLAEGKLDVIIGTHRLLGKDVKFKNLGLLVLDEEQRFGVTHKEKIKTLKTTVNVLTMTATPIPRTLHMSLSGIRSISTLNEPPADRLPVQTYVTEYTDSLAVDCINRELARGGQAFVVYNRVETIYHFAATLQELLPNVNMVVCHGQMTEAELERNVKLFYDGTADVMIATTIIENGIDLPRANTMLVVDADRFGLSQLYQLRGRVGRSNRLAYAYFTYTPGKLLGETATKRLAALLEFTAFGSGFKIAMRDLEIRGAGNVLGAEQHGHMERVGYDLYCKILAEVVGELTGESASAEQECEVVMDVDAFIPDDYIPDAESRMNFYSRIASVRSLRDRERLIAELADVYGTPPKPVTNLVTIGLYKGFGIRLGLERIRISRTYASLTLRKVEDWVARVDGAKHDCYLRAGSTPVLEFTPRGRNLYESVFTYLTDALAAKSAKN